MTGDDFDEAQRACMSKQRYRSAQHAGNVARARRVAGLRIYPCAICRGFHLTSATLGQVAANQASRRPLWDRLYLPMPGHQEPPTKRVEQGPGDVAGDVRETLQHDQALQDRATERAPKGDAPAGQDRGKHAR